MTDTTYQKNISPEWVNEELGKIRKTINPGDVEMMKKIISFMDLTTLNTQDNGTIVKNMIEKVNKFQSLYPGMPQVAAVCVYPNFVKDVKDTLTDKNVRIACVTGGFPSSQTFLSVKLVETNLAVEKGADEVDMVLSVGTFNEKDYTLCADEITLIKTAAGKAHLKVILESGILSSLNDVRIASILAMEAGADFIKTSTGKVEPAATPEAVFVMCDAIKDYYNKTGRKVGLKPAGGIATTPIAMEYAAIVKYVLGEEWLTPELFRLGASRLANHVLNAILKPEKEIKYF
ncbi:MAG: deoxyribose-phosphate aldolase [Bacteroidetes bacterium HGW-Bacteroidetes-21]|jgi:deoxyribose-phosphate aldolase|nr:MAG: deoxyribose-phosphate aldolase [Bacteroidetes bacterium HGW-Bacteroidetes-21]